MSWNPASESKYPKGNEVDLIETLIIPRARDLGGFEVRRVLPTLQRKMVGPFIFFDQMGPVEFLTDQGIDVRPHPHIGLATVTYLFAGEIFHRDSLGTRQRIRPGEVNWMTAGKGITHSGRTAPDVRSAPSSPLFGIQTWLALPEKYEEIEPDFEHHGEDALPVIEDKDKKVRLILGNLYGECAPVKTYSDLFYADVELQAGAHLPLDAEHEERGLYLVEGDIEIAGRRFTGNQMMIFRPGDAISIRAHQPSRFLLLGGETLNGPRYIWWNFVSSSKERLEEAKEAWRTSDWQSGPFLLPPDEHEFIPLPDYK